MYVGDINAEDTSEKNLKSEVTNEIENYLRGSNHPNTNGT